MIRTILSPGVELKEIDKSQYPPDVGSTPRALVMGFASQGPVQTTTDITSMADFRTIYGTPTNEVERYFYNAADQMIGVGATVVASKIPYESDKNYVAVKYRVGNPDKIKPKGVDELTDQEIEEYIETFARSTRDTEEYSDISVINNYDTDLISSVSAAQQFIGDTDSSITSLTPIYPYAVMHLDNEDIKELDGDVRSGIGDSGIIIVDKSRGSYKTFTGNGSSVDCLGLLPVVTTAANAMAIASEISDVNMDSTFESDITTINLFEPLNKEINYITDLVEDGIKLIPHFADDEISGYWSMGGRTYKEANTLNSISKIASQFFPAVTYSSQVNASANSASGLVPFDHSLFSYIGVVVFKVLVDRGSGCLTVEPIESFAGSLLRNAKDIRTNASTFIENVINTTSNYISIYVGDDIADQDSDVEGVQLSKNSLLYAPPANNIILGLPSSQKKKSIMASTITVTMDKVFKSQSNILGTTLDVVVDAGLSTIFECVADAKYTQEDEIAGRIPKGKHVGDEKPISVVDLQILKQDVRSEEKNKGPWPGWRNIVKELKQFCEGRKDCAFVCDSPRFMTLRNQRKIVNPNDMSKTVADDILPKIKLISGINTSYGWGYTTWLKIGCAADGTSFWCPPSIFGAAAYIDTRTRWHTWDAPAGMTRGVVSVDDTSFEPDLNARNVIYSNGWNYALTDIQNGVTTLEGQKTFQSYTSAFDRINVRSLFLDLERRVFKIARNYIYEPNTADTRQQFVDNITPIFSSTKAQGGCYDYKIICDESLNTPQVIDNNELRVRIGVQPVKTIEFILLEFVASRTGSDWSELVME